MGHNAADRESAAGGSSRKVYVVFEEDGYNLEAVQAICTSLAKAKSLAIASLQREIQENSRVEKKYRSSIEYMNHRTIREYSLDHEGDSKEVLGIEAKDVAKMQGKIG